MADARRDDLSRRSSRLLSSRGLGRSGAARRRTRATLRFSRLRNAQESEMRDIVTSAWDEQGCPTGSSASNEPAEPVHLALDVCAVSTSAADFSSASGLPVPLLRQIIPGKRWSCDCLAVVHNAVRAEISALYDILTAMLLGAKASRVTLAELRAFFAWFASFEAFVVTALKAEEEVLYPWLEQWGRIEGALSTGARIAAKGAVIRGVRDTSACAALLGIHLLPAATVLSGTDRKYHDALQVGFAEVAPASAAVDADGNQLSKHVLEAVAQRVSKLTLALIAYFQEQEDAIPKIIEGLYDAEDVHSSGFERRTVRAIWKSGRKDEATLILVKGFGNNERLARAWTQRNLRRIDRLSLPLWRRRYVAGRGAVVERFRVRKRRNQQLLALHGYTTGGASVPCAGEAAGTKLSLPYVKPSSRVVRTISNREV